MRDFILLASGIFLASVAFAVHNSPELVLHHPFEKRADSPHPGTHMLQLVVTSDLFQSLLETMAVLVPTQVNAIRIPDLAGATTAAPIDPVQSWWPRKTWPATNYAFTNLALKSACMNRNAVLKLGHNAIDFKVDMDVTLVGDYKLSGMLRYVPEEGDFAVRLRNASVTGKLTMTRSQIGGLTMHIDHFDSDIRNMNLKIENTFWKEWLRDFLKFGAGKPILTAAISAVVSTQVPPLVNSLLADTASQGMILSDGRRMETQMEVVDDPRITPDALIVDMDLITRYSD